MNEQLTSLLMKLPAKQKKKATGEELKLLIHDNAKLIRGKKRIACSVALRIAAEMHVSPKRVSRICSEEGVKIRSCMLDCFE
jgi:plasmid maintenance system antidote protein VapI